MSAEAIKRNPNRGDCPVEDCGWWYEGPETFGHHMASTHPLSSKLLGEIHELTATFTNCHGDELTMSFKVDNAYERAFSGDLGKYLDGRFRHLVQHHFGNVDFTQTTPWTVQCVESP